MSVERLTSELGARGDDTLTFDELVQQSGLDAELVRLATDTGLVRPLRTPAGAADDAPGAAGDAGETAAGDGAIGGTLYSAGALTMLRAATELLAAEMPLDDLIGLALRHASNMEAVAADAVGLFADRFADRPAAERAELAARLIPLVTDLVAQHFRESLVEHATDRILAGDIDDEPAKRAAVTAEAAPSAPRASAGLRARRTLTLECRELSGELDPLAVFAASDAHQRVYWACPDDDLEFCALGSAFDASAAAGADRFASVAEALSLLDVTVTGDSGHPIGPLAVGGFSFRPEAPAAGSPWEAFGTGCLTVPEVLVVRRGGQSWLTSTPGAPETILADPELAAGAHERSECGSAGGARWELPSRRRLHRAGAAGPRQDRRRGAGQGGDGPRAAYRVGARTHRSAQPPAVALPVLRHLRVRARGADVLRRHARATGALRRAAAAN